MKCLSLWQPWASLVVHGFKHVETRSWETSYRGPLLIHASAKFDRPSMDLIATPIFEAAFVQVGVNYANCDDLPFGAIIGVVDLIKCVPVAMMDVVEFAGQPALTEREREFGDFSPGRFCWLLGKYRFFLNPIEYCGHQRIFNVPDEVVAAQLRTAVPA
ncbi:MAG: ASCH domain-containing protein [Phycisphaerae bacterium]